MHQLLNAIELAEENAEIYDTIGWHPTEAGSYNQEIEDMISNSHTQK